MKILVCDDHALFREGLELVLAQLDPEAELLGVGNAEDALACLRERAGDLDLVLLDIALPGMDGFQALEAIRGEFPAVPTVLVSASERASDARKALDGGAAGFIPKSTRGKVLVGALQLVLAGGVYVPPELMETGSSTTLALTPRQEEVLRLLARGLTNKDIARVLGISEGTVKTHVLRVYEALEVTNRTEAAMRMHELGLDG